MRRIVLVILLVSASAHAEKHRHTATVLSGLGTGVSSALLLAGFLFAPSDQDFDKPLLYTGLASAVITPSLGEWYGASSASQFLTLGMAARVAGAGLATVALTQEQKTQTCEDAATSDKQCKVLKGAGIALLGVAAIAFIGGMAYDVSTAGDAVDDWNARHGFMVEPTAIVTPTGTTTGVALVGKF